MPRLYPSLVINLIGSNKNISIAKNEIKDYLFHIYFSFKEIDNKSLEKEFKIDTLTKDLYINPCSWISCNEIKNIHDLTKNHKNLYSCAFLVLDTDMNNKNNSLINCKHIHEIYNIKNTLKEKESLLFSILFSDYSRFKI